MNFFKVFFRDLAKSLYLLRAVIYISWSDLRARYKRSFLGPIWMVITLGFGSVGIGLLWSFLWGPQFKDQLPSIAIGFLIWIFISQSIVEGSSCFITKSSLIQNIKLPLSIFPLMCLSRTFINFAHSWIIILLMLIVYPQDLNVAQVILPINLVIVLINLYLIAYFFGMLCAKYRDLEALIASVIPLLFFLSPVLFSIRQFKSLENIMLLNPITYFITLLRDPLFGIVPEIKFYTGSFIIMITLYLFLNLLVYKKHKNLVFWV